MVDTRQPDSIESPQLTEAPELSTRPAPPTLRKRNPLRSAIPWTMLVAVVAAAVYAWLHRGQTTVEVQYRVATVRTQMVRRTVSASGVIEPWTTVDIKSKAGGRIDRLLVDVGDHVRANQVIARIDPTDSLLTYHQAEADTSSADAKESQSDQQYRLQLAQTRLQIDQASAAVTSAEASLAAAGARLATARQESQTQPSLVEASIAQAQASLDATKQDRAQLDATQPQDLASAQSSLDQAAANLRLAQVTLDRKSGLLEMGYIAAQEVDEARAAFEVARAQDVAARTKRAKLDEQQRTARAMADAKVRQAEAQLRNAKAQAVETATRRNAVQEAEASYRQAKAALAQARTQLRQAHANAANDAIRQLDIVGAKASKARAAASLANAKTTLDQTVVRAPSEGIVLQKYVEQGTIITSGLSLNSSGTSIVQLADVSRLYVDVAVDETDIANVKSGQRVEVSVDAYPGAPFDGKVVKISPRAEVEQNVTTVHVRVELSSRSRRFSALKPTMNATCEFIVEEKPSVLAIPADAIHSDHGQSYVEVAVGGKVAPADATLGVAADPDQLIRVKTQRRPVNTGVQGDDLVEVMSGLTEGERVVLQRLAPVAASNTTQARNSPFGGGGPGMGGGPGGVGRSSGGR